jgi:hypothetical protein
MEYSFLSQEKFNQIVEEHIQSLSKSDKSIITKEMAQQIIRLIENNFDDKTIDYNTIRWARLFIIRNINGTKYLYKKITKRHKQVEVRVCTKEEMYPVFCRVHNGDLGEGHRGQNATWTSLNTQYCCFPQNIVHAACKVCSVCCSTKSIRKIPEGKPIIANSFLQRVQVTLTNFRN